MKFLNFTVFDVHKSTDIAAVNDKFQAAPTEGYKVLHEFACMSPPFPVPPNSIVGVSITEVKTTDAMLSHHYQLLLAGATIYRVPIMEVPLASSIDVERKGRG